MPSSTSRETFTRQRPAYRDVSSPFPNIRVALIGGNNDILRVFSVSVTMRMQKHFSDRGIIGPVRDAMVVDFLEFVLCWEYLSRELDEAWENYRMIYFDDQDRWLLT